jgi:flagellin
MRELALQSANDTLSDADRSNTEKEYQNLKLELDRISQSTEFNGHKLLNGTSKRLDFQVGINASPSDNSISYDATQIDSGTQALGVNEVSIGSKYSAQDSLSKIDNAINKISGQRATIGSLQNRLSVSSANMDLYTENMSAANSRIRDVDVAVETSKLAQGNILKEAGTAVLAQANNLGQGAMKLLG